MSTDKATRDFARDKLLAELAKLDLDAMICAVREIRSEGGPRWHYHMISDGGPDESVMGAALILQTIITEEKTKMLKRQDGEDHE